MSDAPKTAVPSTARATGRTHHVVRAGLCASAMCLATCHAGAVKPSSVTFPQAFVGLKNTQPLVFTLDDEPLPDPQFSVSPGLAGVVSFDIVPSSPLRPGPVLVCVPAAVGDSDSLLTVSAGGSTYSVPIHVHAVAVPECSPNPSAPIDLCHEESFDQDLMQCAVEAVPDGAPCGDELICPQSDTPPTCRAGQCLSALDPGTPLCPTTATPGPLRPLWAFDLGGDPLSGVATGAADSSGNVYWPVSEDPQPDGQTSINIVALSPDGVLLWRNSIPVTGLWLPNGDDGCTGDSGMQLVVSGEVVVGFTTCIEPDLQAWSVADGGLLWSDSTAVVSLTGAGNGQLFAVEGTPPFWGAEVLVLDAATGAHLTTFPLPTNSKGGLVSDAQGTVFGALYSGELVFAANASNGVIWEANWANLPGEPRPVASDGEHVFDRSGVILNAADGGVLFAPSQAESIGGVVAIDGGVFEWLEAAEATNGEGCLARARRIDPDTGTVLWSCDVSQGPSPPQLAMALGGDIAVVNDTRDGLIMPIYDADGGFVAESTENDIGPPGPAVFEQSLVSNQRLWVALDTTLVFFDLSQRP